MLTSMYLLIIPAFQSRHCMHASTRVFFNITSTTLQPPTFPTTPHRNFTPFVIMAVWSFVLQGFLGECRLIPRYRRKSFQARFITSRTPSTSVTAMKVPRIQPYKCLPKTESNLRYCFSAFDQSSQMEDVAEHVDQSFLLSQQRSSRIPEKARDTSSKDWYEVLCGTTKAV